MIRLKITTLFLTILFLGCKEPTEEVFLNYKEHEKEILDAKKYFSSIMPNDVAFYIKFHPKDKVDFTLRQKNYWNKSSWLKSPIFDEYGQYREFDIDMNSGELSLALDLINIDRKKLEKIRRYLNKANCISISKNFNFQLDTASAYISIGYPTADLYGLNYIMFENSMSSKLMADINDACNYKKINNKVLVEYGGPAFGSNCFPDKRD
ncbi:hypothetical protein DBR43_09415 [Pedobacter sp. KBW06]|uniref:hypothetical protein n=1 Tax=Pedobacter sp. KBW06 TaxID=2153359 RepID=UPI000F5ADF2B|nr:hypothetical protein [Pedobacter sp. KBW06]RQO75548.1 hypothetical protein DBR43_09415 [Pedobacter sp. KBW06]